MQALPPSSSPRRPCAAASVASACCGRPRPDRRGDKRVRRASHGRPRPVLPRFLRPLLLPAARRLGLLQRRSHVLVRGRRHRLHPRPRPEPSPSRRDPRRDGGRQSRTRAHSSPTGPADNALVCQTWSCLRARPHRTTCGPVDRRLVLAPRMQLIDQPRPRPAARRPRWHALVGE